MKRTVRMLISVDVTTKCDNETITKGIVRGLYRGLDSPPIYVAQPADIKINSIEEIEIPVETPIDNITQFFYD